MLTSNASAIALDLGTTTIKAGLLSDEGELGGIVAQPAPEITVSDGCYESDALAYAQTAEQVLAECLAQAGAAPQLPLGMCSQRSSFLIWEHASGQPITPLISWQDTRGAASCEALQNSEYWIRELTGLRLTPYYFAPKLRVLLQQHPAWRAQLERGELLVGTLDTFLIWRWTGGRYHVTDASMAARTLLMDIRQLRWSHALCELFGIPQSILPEIKPSAGLNLPLTELFSFSQSLSRPVGHPLPHAGEGRGEREGVVGSPSNNALILQASMGDQSAALFASVGVSRSEVLVNLGTGGFVVRYWEEEAVQAGYLRTLAFRDNYTHLAIEGTLNSLAAALAPFPAAECRSAELATEEIFCIAEPSGLGAPYFRQDIGLHFSASVAHLSSRQIAGLLLEGIIFRVVRVLEDFQRASPIARVYLSGGLSELECLQQGIAQCAPCEVYRLRQKDASLQGAALLAAGMEVAQRDAEKIVVARRDHALPDKYQRWKVWFDALLEMPLP